LFVVCSTTLQEIEPIIEQPNPIEGQGVSETLSNPGTTPEGRKRQHDADDKTVDSGEPPKKQLKHFEMSEADESDWELPNDLLQYGNKYLTTHYKDQTIDEKVLETLPVPKNIRSVKSLTNISGMP